MVNWLPICVVVCMRLLSNIAFLSGTTVLFFRVMQSFVIDLQAMICSVLKAILCLSFQSRKTMYGLFCDNPVYAQTIVYYADKKLLINMHLVVDNFNKTRNISQVNGSRQCLSRIN